MKAKLGDNEIALAQRVRRTLDRALIASVDQDESELLQVLAKSELPPNDPLKLKAAAMLDSHVARRYEQEVSIALRRVGAEEVVLAAAPESGYDMEALIGKTRLPVVTRHVDGPIDKVRLARTVRLSQSGQLGDHPCLLVVTAGLLTPDAEQFLRSTTHVAAAQWRGPEDDEQLADAVRKLLSA